MSADDGLIWTKFDIIISQLSLNVDQVQLGPTLGDLGLSKCVKVVNTVG